MALLSMTSCAPQAGLPERARAVRTDRTAVDAEATADNAVVQELLEAMLGRLEVMHEVARYKWNARQPINDPERERRLLEALERRGKQFGLPVDEARPLMQAQIDAGKLIQQADWDEWQRIEREPFSDAADLQTELRPRIDRISEKLLEAYAKLRHELSKSGARESLRRQAERALREAGFNDKIQATALRGWLDRDRKPAEPAGTRKGRQKSRQAGSIAPKTPCRRLTKCISSAVRVDRALLWISPGAYLNR
jgi:chorismate mutase